MLVAGIDRNKTTEPEKGVNRIVSSKPAYRIMANQPAPNFQKHLQKRKGIILRNGDLRNGDRRDQSAIRDTLHPKQRRERKRQERRQMNNRLPQSSWNSQTHEIVIIAIEKDPAAKSLWNVGEEVIVGPSGILEANATPQIKIQTRKSGSQTGAKADDDYILHLSRSLEKKP